MLPVEGVKVRVTGCGLDTEGDFDGVLLALKPLKLLNWLVASEISAPESLRLVVAAPLPGWKRVAMSNCWVAMVPRTFANRGGGRVMCMF